MELCSTDHAADDLYTCTRDNVCKFRGVTFFSEQCLWGQGVCNWFCMLPRNTERGRFFDMYMLIFMFLAFRQARYFILYISLQALFLHLYFGKILPKRFPRVISFTIFVRPLLLLLLLFYSP